MHVIIISLNPVQSSSSNSTLLFTSISVCIGFFLLLLFFCYSHLLVVIVYIYIDASYLSDEISIYSSLSFVLKKRSCWLLFKPQCYLTGTFKSYPSHIPSPSMVLVAFKTSLHSADTQLLCM